MKILTETFGPAQTQSYLLIEGNEAIWIDPAPSSAHWVDQILSPNISAKAIFLTHSHWDHISDLGKSLRFEKAPIYVHPLDASNIHKPGSDGLNWPSKVPLPQKTEAPIHFLEEGQLLSLGPHTFQVLHTPGHSPGSVVFFCKEQSLLISGDSLFARGWGRVDLPHSNPQMMRQSLTKISLLPKSVRFLPGHGPSALLSELHWLNAAIRNESFWV